MKNLLSLWSSQLKPGDLVIDATVGNGKDTYALAKILAGRGRIVGYDVQKLALLKAEETLKKLPPHERAIITLKEASHTHFDEKEAALIVYNLGYLPGGDKSITTLAETTLLSIKNGLNALCKEGMLSISCYPGHKEGEREQKVLLEYLATLDKKWRVSHTQILNRDKAPSWIIVSQDRT